jgi:RHS repeat-associated protein
MTKPMRNVTQRRGLCLTLVAILLIAMGPTAWAFDSWGDNGSSPAGGGNGGGPGGGGPGPDPGPSDGEPVSIYSGQYTLNAVDVSIAGRMPLRVKRLYRSASNYQGMFGRGWNIEFNERIFVLATNGNLMIRRNDSARDQFTNLGNNTYAPPVGFYQNLVRNLDGSYTLTERGGAIRQYDDQGCLATVQDRNGNQLVFSYEPGGKQPINAISDYSHFTNAILVARDFRLSRMEVAYNGTLSGRYLLFFYDANGRTTNVTDFTGRSWTFQYDQEGELLSVTTPPGAGFPAGLSTYYTYSPSNHFLATVTDKSGNAVLTNRYDSAGHVVQQIWGAAVFSFGYPNATNRWLTNGNGYVVLRNFDTNGQMIERRDYTAGLRPTDPPYYSTLYLYTTNAQQQAEVMYPAGNVDASVYDNTGNLVQTRRKTSNATNSPQDLVTSLTYEPRFNQVKTVTGARGEVTTNVFDYEVPASGATNGNIIQTIYPANNGVNPVVSFAFTPQGDVAALTNQLGVVTRNSYDPVTGFLLQRIDAFGTLAAVTNTYTYDARGNLLTITDPLGRTTTNQYDNLDRLIQTTTPAPNNYVTMYSYTGNGRIAQIRKQTGDLSHPWQTNSFAYDMLDHLLIVADDSGHTTYLAYDANGNAVQTIDPNTNITARVYDERNLLWKLMDAQSNTVVRSYSPNGFVATWTDPRTNTTSLAYDAYGRLIGITNADGAFELLVPDAEGNIIAKRKRNGLWTTNSYDAMNQLVTKIYSDGSMVQMQTDLAGRPVSITDSNGVSRFAYDPFGRTITSTNGFGQALGYAYDPIGNLTRLTYPDNSFVLYSYDTLNRLTNVNYGGTKEIAGLTYDGLGRRTRIDYGDGTFATYTYDSANRLVDLNHNPAGGGASLAHFTYSFDDAGNRLTLNTVGTRFPGQSIFQYDSTYQLTGVQYPAGSPFPATIFQYDSVGNRLQITAGGTTVYVPNSRNQYTSVGGQAQTYAPDGGLTSEGAWSYGYDQEDRLVTAEGPGVNATYTYDSFGRRVAKNVNGTVQRFLYNDVGDNPMLLCETDGSGNIQSKYVMCGISPLALIVSNTVFSLHCDHLERPVLATDAGGAVAWEAAYSAFGEANLASTNRITQPLRSPGLYADSESSLQYNLSRFYDATQGRFISEDPGLEAGSPLFSQVQDKNAYAYTRNNPVNTIDPNGQSLLVVCSAGLPLCSGAIFCSLNVGICSAGVFCSANVGACSVGLACSGSAAGACSAGLACSGTGAGACSGGMVCSGGGATACSGTVGSGLLPGACSAASFCSAQIGTSPGSACSASMFACSAQVGSGIGSVCSANVVGACSGQVGVGAAACSAQVAGVCSGQAGPGPFACSGNVTVGACSAQVGAGPFPSYCSAQGAGACSAQAGVQGTGSSYCSVQGAGACSAQGGWGTGANNCSVQGAGACSANEGGSCSTQGAGNCSGAQCKNAQLWESGGSQSLLAFGSVGRPASLSALHIGAKPEGGFEVQLSGRGFNRFEVLAGDAQQKHWQPLYAGRMVDGTISQWGERCFDGDPAIRVKIRMEETCGRIQEWGPLPVAAAQDDRVSHVQKPPHGLFGLVILLPLLSVLLISSRLD